VVPQTSVSYASAWSRRQPKVDQLQRRARRLVLVQQILRLEVAVHDLAPVEEVESGEDVVSGEGGVSLGALARATVGPHLRDALEQLAARARLHHQVAVARILSIVDDVADVAVLADDLENRDLLAEVVPVLRNLQPHRLARARLAC